ncbi:metallophosphoesterase [Halomonas vilamensis]|uniref:Metallophosphoesterase n=1 Tax=Vreelandella vilamensis TaxID=531309 RepID=A0ABU1H1I3_9GAMM|nr:metallophosphoesterase [Halomonas vilamensis]MDR5898170.1 metallophosphoesterase [Halomonas vilamensis]
MRIVQVTDAHLYADPKAHSRTGIPLTQFSAVIDAVKAQHPDFVIVTGDISQDETATSYAHAVEQLTLLSCPWFWLPGNHDQLDLMEAEHPLLDEVDLDDWRMLLLNTQVPGQPYGELGPDKLGAMAKRLEADTRPTLIAMHHPPVEVGASWMDAIGLQDRAAFWQALTAYPHVKLIVFGHAHQAFAQSYAIDEGHVEVYGCPATSDQFMPRAKAFAVDEASRPGYRVIELDGAQWQTWIERVNL